MTTPPQTRPNPAAPRPPSNAPTIFLLILVIAAFVFVGWWAFWGTGASVQKNAVLPLPPPNPAPAASPVPKGAPSR